MLSGYSRRERSQACQPGRWSPATKLNSAATARESSECGRPAAALGLLLWKAQALTQELQLSLDLPLLLIHLHDEEFGTMDNNTMRTSFQASFPPKSQHVAVSRSPTAAERGVKDSIRAYNHPLTADYRFAGCAAGESVSVSPGSGGITNNGRCQASGRKFRNCSRLRTKPAEATTDKHKFTQIVINNQSVFIRVHLWFKVSFSKCRERLRNFLPKL